MAIIYKVKDWESNFEGAKSKTYNNKTSCQLPTKHGLGYKKLVRQKDGAAIFGAWCSLIQILSRHPKQRNGYCTDTGSSCGRPYTTEDLEILTDIPAKHFEKMFSVCTSQDVGWVEVIEDKDTTGDQQGTTLPLDLDSNLDSNLDSYCTESDKSASGQDDGVFLDFPCTGSIKKYELKISKLDEYVESFDTIDVVAELKKAKQWILDNPTRKKTSNGMTKFLGGWLNRAANSAGKSSPSKKDPIRPRGL